MSDNVIVTAGSGTTIAADEVTDVTLGTVKVQYVKLMDGTLDGTSKASVGTNGLKVDGSAVIQPVSGTVTANIGTTGNLALDATLTGGTQKAIARGGAKGSTTAADVTSTASGANHQLLDVGIYDASGNQITSFGGGAVSTQTEDAASNSGDTGVFMLGVRNDTPSLLTSANGDYAGLTTNAYNQLHVSPCAITTISQTPTVSTTPAYTGGDSVGSKLTFANATRIAAYSGRVKSIIVVDQNKQNAVIDLILFNADPSGTTFTDNAVLDIADADMSKIIARVPLSDWCGFNDNSVCVVNNLSLDFNLASGSSLHGCLVTRGTPTFAATNDIIVTLVIEQD